MIKLREYWLRLLEALGIGSKPTVMYIGGSDFLPPPLEREEEQDILDAVQACASDQAYHPVRDYLNGLTWDGTARLDRLFIDYLGAEDSEYVRAVTRKAFTAAVARIMRPGCKYDTMLVRHFFQAARVVILKICVASQYKLAALHVNAHTGFNQVMQVLLGHKPAHAQNVLPRLYAQFRKVFGKVTNFRRRHSIIYKVYVLGASILSCNQVLDDLRNDNHVIGKHTAHALTQFQHGLGCPAPFVAVVIRPMMGEHHLHAAQFGVWSQHRRADGVDMQDICPQCLCLVDGTERMDDGLERLLLWRRYIHELYPLPFRKRVANIVLSSNYCYVITFRCNPWE